MLINKFNSIIKMQTLFNYIIVALLGGILTAIVSCCKSSGSNEENRSLIQSSESGEQKNMTDIIRNFFDSQDWKYNIDSEDDSVESFMLGFTGVNEEIMFCVNVMPNQNMYQIIGQSKTVIPLPNIEAAVRAINRYNLKAKVVCGCVGEDGSINFWMGRNTDGDTFSEEAFSCDFEMVMRVVDTATSLIFKEALSEKEHHQKCP